MKNPSRLPLVKLPHSIDLLLFLIREELKSQKLFNGLQQAGIDDCYYQTHLGRLILAKAGLHDGKDETFEFYYRIIERRAKKVEMDNDVLMKQALKVYVELMLEKGRRQRMEVRSNK